MKVIFRWFKQLVVFVFCGVPALVTPQEREHPGAPTVQLRYPENNVISFYNEVTIRKSATRTYFAVTGWHNGYFGIQEVGNGKKQLIFSVWDSKQNDPSQTAETKRVQVVYKDNDVRVGRFGNEGSGGQSFFPYNWKLGVKYAFLVKAKQVGPRAEYSGYFRAPEMKEWRHLVTFSTLHAAKSMHGLYAFIEDFARTDESATQWRSAIFSNAWVRTEDEHTIPVLRAKITTQPDPLSRVVQAFPSSDGFELRTGGDTQDSEGVVGKFITSVANSPAQPPDGL